MKEGQINKRIKELDLTIQKERSRAEPFENEQEVLKAQRDLIKRKKLLGKCFRYRNSYGFGSKWWLYGKVTHIDKDGFRMLTAEKVPLGIEIKLDTRPGAELWGTWEPITSKQFQNAFKKLLDELVRG